MRQDWKCVELLVRVVFDSRLFFENSYRSCGSSSQLFRYKFRQLSFFLAYADAYWRAFYGYGRFRCTAS